jgi:hypothetical protein
MDGFNKLPKMQCFKEGGHAKSKEMCGGGKAYKAGGAIEKDDMAQDKKMIKKAFKQHDEAEHDKEPTEIKLRKGGRAKKETGTVKKFKVGGSVDNEYSAKKASGDLDRIAKVKDIKPGKAAAPSKAAVKPAFFGSDVEKEKSKPAGDKDAIKKVKPTGDKKADAPNKAATKPSRLKNKNAIDDIDGYKTGGAIKKYADGGNVLTSLRDNIMGSPSQNAVAKANEAKYLRAKQMQQAAGVPMGGAEQAAMGLAGLGQQMQPAAPAAAPVAQKRGGKAGKC